MPSWTTFLLADDDLDDTDLFREALRKVAPTVECRTVENGRQLFDVLAETSAQLPDIIFLDINLPIMDGWECLRNLNSNLGYKNIPVVVYSTSSTKRDIDTAYSLGALLFITKPDDFEELCEILQVISTSSKDLLPRNLRSFQSAKLS